MAVIEALVRESDACRHCGLPVPDLSGGELDDRFCCGGCRAAYALIHDAGLMAYYALPERRGTPVSVSGRGFEEFDHRTFHDLYVRRGSDGLDRTELYLEGVHCASCVWLVERVPLALPGLVRVELDVRRSRARLEWDGAAVSLSDIARALDRLGYRPLPFRGLNGEEARQREDRQALVGIGIAGALATNVMLLAIALYSGWFSGMEPGFARLFRWLSLALTTPALFGPGRVFFRTAFAALRARALHMDVPIALALAAGYLRGAWNTVADHGPIYFDGLAALVFLLLVGRDLQRRAQRSAADAGELLHALSPSNARVVEDGVTRDVPLEAVLPGMAIEVRAGETVPADGHVVAGASTLNLALLTGESRPARAGMGDPVYAGTLNVGARLRIVVERAGAATRLGRLLADLEEATRRRAPIVKLADRLAGRFVAAVLALALVTWAVWHARGSATAIDHAIALLVVTCPCTLALATPLSVTAAVGRAARAGLLIRGGDALERMARPGLIVLDKTGTLTQGRVALEHWQGPDDAQDAVIALERHVSHPIAEGFIAAWPGRVGPDADEVCATVGGGVEGIVAGRTVVVGSPAFVCARASAPPAAWPPLSPRLTPVLVAVDGRVVGRAGFADPIRPEARRVLDTLRRQGWRTRLLSGDDPATTHEVGRILGFAPDEVRGGAGPEDKARLIEAAARQESVVMVGDGVNDAAAIACASVGVGVRGGAEACLAAADVYLSRPGVEPLLLLLDGSRRTLQAIRTGIAVSMAYNVVGAALAIAGVIDPLVAALLMPASSISVILAAWSGRGFRESP